VRWDEERERGGTGEGIIKLSRRGPYKEEEGHGQEWAPTIKFVAHVSSSINIVEDPTSIASAMLAACAAQI